jgi:hypothetical protein
MMIKSMLLAATMASLLAGSALGDSKFKRGDDDRYRGLNQDYRHDDDRRYDENWRYGDRHDDRYRRHVPPARYRADYGYRSAYELAWRDWIRYGRHDRHWNRPIPRRYRGDYGYRSGYEIGWRDAARYYGSGYRPRHWARDPRGSWFFGFQIDG